MEEATVSKKAERNATITYNVMVRHSPFPIKNADVSASSVEEAKKAFIEKAREFNEKKCREVLEHQETAERVKAVKERRESFNRALLADKNGELEWVIRPKVEVEKQRESIDAMRRDVWGGRERIPA